jgi:hypothetical protein
MASRLGCTDPYRLRLCGRLIRDAARTSDSVPKQRAVVCALDQLSQALGIDPFCRDADTDEWSDDRGFAADLSRSGKATRRGSRTPHDPHPLACPSPREPSGVSTGSEVRPRSPRLQADPCLARRDSARDTAWAFSIDSRIWSRGIEATCLAEGDRLRCRILTGAVGRSASSRCGSGQPLPRRSRPEGRTHKAPRVA